MLSFSYRHVGDADGGPASPHVPIVVRAPRVRARLEGHALVDTGASLSSIPAGFMAGLGISPDDCVASTSYGVGGRATCWEYPGGLEAEVCGYRVRIAARFHDTTLGLILGAEDFLRAFRVTFDTRARIVHLDPYEDTPTIESGDVAAAPPTGRDVAPLYLNPPGLPSSGTMPSTRKRYAWRQEIINAIVRAGRPMRLAEIAATLGVDRDSGSLKRELRAMHDAGEITRPGHGLYGLPAGDASPCR
jgi:hypothetical protein